MTTSCQREDDPEPVSFTPDTEQEGMMKLGKKLENPYTVENMRKAYQNLVNRGMLKSGIEIDATHLYIRYLPEDEQELDDFENTLLSYLSEDDMELLEEEYAGHFFDYPLEYEIEEDGTYYYDPELPPGGITWQYTVVPVSYDMPVVNYEVIDPLYLDGAEFEVAYSAGGGMEADVWDLLETEALILAGDPDAEIIFQPGLKSTSWTPSGTVTVWDDVLARQIPLQGAKARARRWFTVYTGITDAAGKFTVSGSFKRPANYSIKWERADWDIREGDWGQAYFNGPKQTGAWNLPISSGKSLRYATIHRALYRYYYGERLGLKAPFIAPWWKSRLKVGYYHDDHWNEINGSAIPFRNNWTFPHACIYGKGYVWKNSSLVIDWISTDSIFSYTIHEIAHVSHWDIIGEGGFALLWVDPGTRIIPESWADAVQWGLTNLVYRTLGQKYGNYQALNYNFEEGNQRAWTKYDDKYYTPLFIDLIDDFNQRLVYGSTNRPNDNVKDYSFSYLESILFGARDLQLLKSLLKLNKPVGVSNEEIDDLIDFYYNL